MGRLSQARVTTPGTLTVPLVRLRRPSFALVAVSLDAMVALPLAYLLNIWQDESYTLHTTSGSAAFAFHEALAFEQNAPLYFVLMDLWRHIDDGVFFLRLFSVLCILAALALVPRIASRYVPRADPDLVTLTVAWNPITIWAAVEMRVYALIVLMSALLLLAFYDGFLARRPKRSAAALYALYAALALYTQYYLAFLIAAQFVVLLFYRRSAIKAYIVSTGAAAIAFLPLLAAVPGQVRNFRAPFAPPALPHSLGVLASILAHDVLPLTFAHASIAYLAIALIAAGAAVAMRRALLQRGDAVVLLLTVLAAGIFAAVTYAARVQVLNRHAVSLYLPAELSVFALLTFLRPGLRMRAATIWCCIALAASTAVIVHTYWSVAKPGDWIRLTAALQEREIPGEPIAVFEAENALPFAYYYRGGNRVVPIPNPVSFERYDLRDFVIRNENQLRDRFPRASRLWLITAGECASADLQFGCGILERYVGAHYRTLYDASFYGSRLRLLAPDARASSARYAREH